MGRLKVWDGSAWQYTQAAVEGSGEALELDYTEKTSNTSITATTEGTANTVITAGAITADGSTEMNIEFYSPYVELPAADNIFMNFVLTDGGTVVGRPMSVATSEYTSQQHRAPVMFAHRLTPSAASHTYDVRAFLTSGTGTVAGGAGGATNFLPASIRITRANPTVNAGAPSTGTAFPSAPATGTRYRRSDLDYEIYFYDGTRWLSEQVYQIEMKPEDGATWPVTATTTVVHRGVPTFGDNNDLWLMNFHTLSNVITTNDGSNYWTYTLSKFNSAGAGATTVATFNTSADSPDTFVNKEITVDALLGAYEGFYAGVATTGSPGNARVHGGHITCRKVAT